MFKIHEGELNKDGNEGTIYLLRSDWDDFGYKTSFCAFLFRRGRYEKIGNLKIGSSDEFYNHEKGYIDIPDEFSVLPDKYFSLGEGLSYYERFIGLLGKDRLSSLNDIVINNKLEYLYKNKVDVLSTSLLRNFSNIDYEQVKKMIFEEDAFKDYKLHLVFRDRKMGFSVTQSDILPTNLHAIIGNNGVGKTRLLESIVREYVPSAYKEINNDIFYSNINESLFPRLIYITTSIFGNLYKNYVGEDLNNGFYYVGFNSIERNGNKTVNVIDNKKDIIDDILLTIDECKDVNRIYYLRVFTDNFMFDKSVNLFLESILCYLDDSKNNEGFNLKKFLMNLSSGHYVILYMILKIVLLVEEKAIILIDEPETHLHPPLLSAFIRSVNDILKQKNALGIIATHSPIVLQEIPSRCVWKIYENEIERPSINTFGESVGVITRDVFQLGIQETGFKKFIQDKSITELEKIEDFLGSEALFKYYMRK